jgi:hypothetical protein
MDEKVKFRKYVVRARNLRYRVPGINEGKSFNPIVGKVIRLPLEIWKIEVNSGNVRPLLPDERQKKKKKVVKKKVSKTTK